MSLIMGQFIPDQSVLPVLEIEKLNLKGKSTSFSKVQLPISNLVIFLFFKKCLKSTLFQI